MNQVSFCEGGKKICLLCFWSESFKMKSSMCKILCPWSFWQSQACNFGVIQPPLHPAQAKENLYILTHTNILNGLVRQD